MQDTRQTKAQLLEEVAALRRELATLKIAQAKHQQAEDALREEANIAAALVRVGQELIPSLETSVILDRLCRLAAECLEGSYSCTLFWQPDEDVYALVAGWEDASEQQEPVQGLQIPHEAVADIVARLEEQEVLEVNSTISPALLTKTFLRRMGLKTALAMRLRRGQDLIGFQICGYREAKRVTVRHFRLARGISQFASLALANARLLEELSRANQVKGELVGAMSHELRTPLHIIIGYNELLQEGMFGSMTAEQRDILGRVGKSARELLDLITATLDLSRLQTQHVPLNLQNVSVSSLFAELETETSYLNHKSMLTLEWHILPELPILHTDLVKLRMILKNLLINALKFTAEGTIIVNAQAYGEGVEFAVADTGIGITPEALPIIFEPFRQAHNSSDHGGVGLGLYIVRQLVQVLGGAISVESTVGKGSLFRVWIPTAVRVRQNPKLQLTGEIGSLSGILSSSSTNG
jgi:signal transduction histidine kinase